MYTMTYDSFPVLNGMPHKLHFPAGARSGVSIIYVEATTYAHIVSMTTYGTLAITEACAGTINAVNIPMYYVSSYPIVNGIYAVLLKDRRLELEQDFGGLPTLAISQDTSSAFAWYNSLSYTKQAFLEACVGTSLTMPYAPAAPAFGYAIFNPSSSPTAKCSCADAVAASIGMLLRYNPVAATWDIVIHGEKSFVNTAPGLTDIYDFIENRIDTAYVEVPASVVVHFPRYAVGSGVYGSHYTKTLTLADLTTAGLVTGLTGIASLTAFDIQSNYPAKYLTATSATPVNQADVDAIAANLAACYYRGLKGVRRSAVFIGFSSSCFGSDGAEDISVSFSKEDLVSTKISSYGPCRPLFSPTQLTATATSQPNQFFSLDFVAEMWAQGINHSVGDSIDCYFKRFSYCNGAYGEGGSPYPLPVQGAVYAPIPANSVLWQVDAYFDGFKATNFKFVVRPIGKYQAGGDTAAGCPDTEVESVSTFRVRDIGGSESAVPTVVGFRIEISYIESSTVSYNPVGSGWSPILAIVATFKRTD